jgi:hypothetical protein
VVGVHDVGAVREGELHQAEAVDSRVEAGRLRVDADDGSSRQIGNDGREAVSILDDRDWYVRERVRGDRRRARRRP